MSGISASVLLRSPFLVQDSARVTTLLREVASGLNETRKGQHWEFTINNRRGILYVVDTDHPDWDFLGVLIEAGWDFDEEPAALILSFLTRGDREREICEELPRRLAEILGGIAGPPEC